MIRNLKKKQGRKNPVYVNFGTRLVTPSEKTNLVGGVFDSVSTRYDIMNDIMSLGIHRIWKRTLVKQIKRTKGQTILDVGGGTGDISLKILKEMECELILLDNIFASSMTLFVAIIELYGNVYSLKALFEYDIFNNSIILSGL